MNDYHPLFESIPSCRHECWDLLRTFANFWHPSSNPNQTIVESHDKTVPTAYQEWQSIFPTMCNWCPRAKNLTSDEAMIDNETFVIRTEPVFNGMLIAKWGIPTKQLSQDDPPVNCLLGDREHPCAERVSQFAVFCALFDTINSYFTSDISPENDHPFPSNGSLVEFPKSFGVIKTEIYEGPNWLALKSGGDWYLRIREGLTDRFVKHEIR